MDNHIKKIADSLEELVKLKKLNSRDNIDNYDFSKASLFSWSSLHSSFMAIDHSFDEDLDYLIGIDKAKFQLGQNTIQFAKGLRVNNVLLWGARGMGKSSLVRATVSKLSKKYPNLKLLEVPRTALNSLGDILRLIDTKDFKFILFCDDLSFSEEEDSYHYLKSLLDGGINRFENIVFYATSNRRHLIKRQMGENSDINLSDEVDQKISLSDRFGIWLGFYPCDQESYLLMVEKYLRKVDFDFNDSDWQNHAIQWQISRGSRSGRSAWQFACHYTSKA